MAVNIVVPQMGESVVEATVGEWLVQEGDAVQIGDPLVSLETDKVDVEVGAEAAGVVSRITHPAGTDVQVGDVLGEIDEQADQAAGAGKTAGAGKMAGADAATDTDGPAAQETSAPAATPHRDPQDGTDGSARRRDGDRATPVARRMAADQGVALSEVPGSGAGGKITRDDVAAYLAQQAAPAAGPKEEAPGPSRPARAPSQDAAEPGRPEQRERMSRRRRTIASRLVTAQQTAAMLTTFNEIDMGAVMDLRTRRRDRFQEQYGVKLGFTSFFVKGVVAALKAFPRLNAEIDGDEMVLKSYYDMGIAVGAEEGLVVPVIRDADRRSFAEIEQAVRTFAQQAAAGTLSLEDLRGGTFTITNGGVFGSMLSTPILNPPQVGILGLHNIVERPVAIAGEIAIRPIMYVALTYDHRLVDGREAVQFLVRVKTLIEDPEALLLAG